MKISNNELLTLIVLMIQLWFYFIFNDVIVDEINYLKSFLPFISAYFNNLGESRSSGQ